MRKKVFSLCMAMALCLALLPVTALAADGATVYVVSVELKGSKEKPAYATTNADTGAVTTEGADENNYNIMWDGETLTLRNAAIKQAGVHNNESIAVYLASGNMNLVLVGKNTVEAPDSESVSSCGIHVGGNLTIRGQDNGSLSVSGGDSGGSSYGIHAFDTITINSGSVNATSGEAKGDSVGIFAEDTSGNYQNSITINGGTVTAMAGNAVGSGWYSCGIRVEGPITITGGTVNATGKSSKAVSSCGIYAVKAVTISGSIVTATGGTAGSGESSGIYAVTVPRFGELKVLIQDATVTATGMACTSGISSGIFAESEGSEGVDVQVAIEDSIVTATGGTAGTGSYGILATTTGTEKSADVTINGNSVVRANTTGENETPISGKTIEKENSIIFENGVGTVHGNVTLQKDLTIEAGESLTIPQNATLTIPEDTTLTNNGTLTIGQGGSLTGNVNGKVLYAVTVQTQGSGSASASTTAAEEGETVTLTASPSSGYHFERWEVVSGGVTLTGNQFTMLDQPVTVKAVFEKNPYIPPTYAVTVPDTTGGTVEVSPSRASSGRTVTITATPDLGYELESLTVLDSRGNEIALTDKGDGKYTFTMPASRVTVEASFAPAPLPFEDVAPGAWYESAVRYAYFHNIMEGMSETEFSPTTALTRAMAAQILYNLEGQPDLSSENLGYPYEDVDAQAWHGNAVYWARITGVATGYGDGTFQPGDSITRQEFAQMLYNYAKYKGCDLTAEGDLSTFPDANSIADWAEAAMRWANGNELINGHDDGTIDAAGIGTRAQAASILMKFDQNLAEN